MIEVVGVQFACAAGGVVAALIAHRKNYVGLGFFLICVLLWTPVVLLMRFVEPGGSYGAAGTLLESGGVALSFTAAFLVTQYVRARPAPSGSAGTG